MRSGVRRSIRNGVLALPTPVRRLVELPMLRIWESYQRRGLAHDDDEPDHGLAVPPADLRVLVHSADRELFLDCGRRQATFFRQMLERNGGSLPAGSAMLDFGCGCGRLTRWWADLQGPAVFGCDPNPQLIEWCQEHLPFVDARVSSPDPPLPYADASFDFVYALSIFTHLPERQAQAWLAELRRVIRPGGHLLFTVHGDAYRDGLSDADAERYDKGEAIVHFETASGTNLCAVYQSAENVRRMIEGFEMVEQFLTSEHTAEAAETRLRQDSYLVAVPAGA